MGILPNTPTPATYPFEDYEAAHFNDFMKSDAGHRDPRRDWVEFNYADRSRETVTLQAGTGAPNGDLFILKAGTVLGMITATSKYVISPASASDGSQNAIAILCEDWIITGSVDTLVGVVARDAEAYASRLIYDASVVGLAAEQVKWAQLATVGIIVRNE